MVMKGLSKSSRARVGESDGLWRELVAEEEEGPGVDMMPTRRRRPGKNDEKGYFDGRRVN